MICAPGPGRQISGAVVSYRTKRGYIRYPGTPAGRRGPPGTGTVTRLLAILTALLAAWPSGGVCAFSPPLPDEEERRAEGTPGSGEEPLDPGLVERVETRILRLDVSVVDRKTDERRTVPGLTKDMFRLRVGYRPMPEERYAEVTLDEICGGAEEDLPAELRLRYLVVLLDFNYMDAEMRVGAARALRSLAARGLPEDYRIKVVGYTRALYQIEDFTRDPERLRAAARFVESVRWVGETPNDTFLPSHPLDDSLLHPTDSFALADVEEDDSQINPGERPPEGYEVESSQDPALSMPTPGGFAPDDPSLLSARARNAFSTLTADQGGNLLALSASLSSLPEPPERELIERDLWDPRASLAAIEAVLRGHAGIRGRKALVLFTGERFSLHDDNLERETREVFEAAQEGFSIWIVDARGFSSEGALPIRRSDLITMLARDTGGETLRSASDLSQIFPRLQETLECYYLFSIPVEAGTEARTYNVSVGLDTDRHPGLWGYSVSHPTRLRLYDEKTIQERRRTSALLNPEDWRGLPVRAELSFPRERPKRASLIPVEISVPLSSLVFRATPEGYQARFLVDAAVDRNGNESVCVLPAPGESILHRLVVPAPPGPESRGHLVMRGFCPYEGEGVYALHAVVTDAEIAEPGAARAVYYIRPRSEEVLTATALRGGLNSGEDYLLIHRRPGRVEVPRDEARAAFVPFGPDARVLSSDRLFFRYVLCGPSRGEATHEVRRLVYRRDPDGPRVLFTLPDSREEEGERPESFPADPFCVEVEDVLPPESLEPGRYGFAVVRQEGAPVPLARIEAALTEEEAPEVLGRIEFEVEPPPSPKPEGERPVKTASVSGAGGPAS